LPGDARFAQKALGKRRVRREAIRKELDGHIATERDVQGAINGAHAAAADLLAQLISWRASGSNFCRRGLLGDARAVDRYIFGHGHLSNSSVAEPHVDRRQLIASLNSSGRTPRYSALATQDRDPSAAADCSARPTPQSVFEAGQEARFST